MWVAFANAKATHILSAKILAYKPNLMIKVLTIRKLTTSLVLNNWALVFFLFLHENVCCGADQKRLAEALLMNTQNMFS